MKIGIVFGGKSYEHEISIVSAIAMKDVLKEELIYIFCDQNRDLYHIPTDTIKSKLFSTGEYKKCDALTLKKGAFTKKVMFGHKDLEVDLLKISKDRGIILDAQEVTFKEINSAAETMSSLTPSKRQKNGTLPRGKMSFTARVAAAVRVSPSNVFAR